MAAAQHPAIRMLQDLETGLAVEIVGVGGGEYEPLDTGELGMIHRGVDQRPTQAPAAVFRQHEHPTSTSPR
jgi:hypothetical protein